MQRFFAKVQNIDVLRVSEEMISKKIFGTCHKLWQAIRRWFFFGDFFSITFFALFHFSWVLPCLSIFYVNLLLQLFVDKNVEKNPFFMQMKRAQNH